ncbi:MAG: Flp family type IVb pilin [Rhodopirellula sp. JB055]|uniref:Flp family type IVb pilin n=1 Tax=Rhodopirellula sp. JB055 TaxID=3342846 RepID=UPI00370A55FD
MRKLFKNKKGQGLVEYGILVGGIALVSLAAVAILGHKTNDLIATVAASLPGAHGDDEGPIVSGKLVNTTSNEDGGLILDANSPGSIEDNLGIEGIGNLVLEAEHDHAGTGG